MSAPDSSTHTLPAATIAAGSLAFNPCNCGYRGELERGRCGADNLAFSARCPECNKSVQGFTESGLAGNWNAVNRKFAAAVEPDRLLKDALFACLKAGGSDRSYGGVLTKEGRHGWVRFTTELPSDAAEADEAQAFESWWSRSGLAKFKETARAAWEACLAWVAAKEKRKAAALALPYEPEFFNALCWVCNTTFPGDLENGLRKLGAPEMLVMDISNAYFMTENRNLVTFYADYAYAGGYEDWQHYLAAYIDAQVKEYRARFVAQSMGGV